MTRPTWLALTFGVWLLALPAHALPGSTVHNGVQSPALKGELPVAVRGFVESRRTALRVPATSTLDWVGTHSTRFGGSFHFEQRVRGIPVDRARVVVTLDSERRVVRVASSAVPYRELRMEWRLSPLEAIERAAVEVAGSTRGLDGRPHSGTKRTAFLVGEALHAGYLVHVPTLRALENWYLGVDAVTGEVLWQENRAHTAHGAQVYPTNPTQGPLGAVTLPYLPSAGPTFLDGERLTAWNCCPNEGCAEAGAPKRAKGQLQTGQGPLPYDLAICDRRQVATDDPALHASGDFVYTPVDPPTSPRPVQSDPADSDAFAEVHGYFHANKVYDYVRALSVGPGSLPGATPFQMRDARRGKKPAIWVNISQPDFDSATQSAAGLVGNQLSRVDNAAFSPVEAFEFSTLPEYALDVDTLMLYQGNRADFTYDAPVVWHEFGHGIIYSTASFAHTIRLSPRGALNEGGALHEGVADYLAAALGQDPRIGSYVAQKTGEGGALRTLQNQHRCPDVLWGEVHRDSLHFSGALWEARSTLFAGNDQGNTFDAAVFAALVSMTPRTGFSEAGTILAHQVGLAFPGLPDAEAKLTALLRDRGVVDCSGVLDVTLEKSPRVYYYVPGARDLGIQRGAPIPGPYQFRIRVPNGAKSVSVAGHYFSFNSQDTSTRLVARSGTPVTFSASGGELVHDGTWELPVTRLNAYEFEGKLDVQVPCGGELYFTFVNRGGGGRTLQEVSFDYAPADSCPPVDPPVEEPVTPGDQTPQTPDAQLPENPAEGPQTLTDDSGCGCGAGALAAPGWLVLLSLLGFARRTRAHRR